MKHLRVGIVGMGKRGKMYARTLGQNPHARLTAFAEVSPALLAEAEADFGVPGYGDFRALLDKEELDLLIVATPDFAHKEPFLAAAEKRIHIMVEKPLAVSLCDAQEMYDAVKRNGIRCKVAFENRWNNVFVAMIERAADREKTGEILAMNVTLNDTIYVPTKMLSWAARSDPAFFLLAHAADLACLIKGQPVQSVYATGVKQLLASRGIDTYDSIMTHVVFADGTHASFENSWIAPETMPMLVQFEFRILGEKQAFAVNFANQMLSSAGEKYESHFTAGHPVGGRMLGSPSFMLHSFIDEVRLDRPVYSNEEDGMVNMRLLDAVHRSLEEQRVIAL